MPKIFISYRRADSKVYAGRLHDRLVTAFGAENVFMDVNNDNIPLGSDFRTVLRNSVGVCDALLVLIGKSWVNVANANGVRRLDDTGDFVRLEIETGLQRPACRVIPVLVDGAAMPGTKDLPDTLQELAYKNAAVVRDDPDFHPDVNKIVRALESTLSSVDSSTATNRPATPSPATPFDVYGAIDHFYKAVDARDWMLAQRHLQEIRESGAQPPKTFDIEAHENDVWLELESQEREREYNIVRRMAQVSAANPQRIWEALNTFWESYPGYDPDQLARFKPLTAPEHFARAEDARSEDKYQDAIRDYTEAIRLEPQFATAYNNRGYCYCHIGEYERGLADYTEAIRLNPRYANAYNNRGAFYNDRKEFDLALADLNMALQLDPSYAKAYHHRGICSYGKGDYARAIADHEAALRYDPAHPYAKQALQRAQTALAQQKS